MLPIIVMTAIGFTFLWFALFIALVTSTYLEGRHLLGQMRDLPSINFLTNVKYAMALGVGTVVVLTASEVSTILGLFQS